MSNLHLLDASCNDLLARAKAAFRRLAQAKLAPLAADDLGEAEILELLNEIGRDCMEHRLREAVADEGEQLEVAGKLYKRINQHPGTYHSICGPLRVVRGGYRERGKRNPPVFIALDKRFGLVERMTPELATCIAHGRADHTSRDLHEVLARSHCVPPSRSTLERAGTKLSAALEQVEREKLVAVRKSEKLPEGAAAISIGFDRTSLPMEEERGPYEPPNTRRKNKDDPRKRDVNVHYRMPFVGTFSILDANGETLVVRRYEAMPKEGLKGVLNPVMGDVRHALGQDANLSVGLVQDGALELWDTPCAALENEALVSDWYGTIDWYHATERLASALQLLPRENWLKDFDRWKKRLAEEEGAAEALVNFLTKEADPVKGDKGRQVRSHIKYFKKRTHLMNYAHIKSLGLPIGSGPTEGACKSLIGARAKRSGQRWKEAGASGVLSIRAMKQSGRLDAFLGYFHANNKLTLRFVS